LYMRYKLNPVAVWRPWEASRSDRRVTQWKERNHNRHQ